MVQELCPKDKTLSVKDRHHLARPAKERWSFVEAALSFAKENPSLLPEDIKMDKVEELLNTYHLLMTIDQSLTLINQLLGDNHIVVGNELFSLSNIVYKMAQIQEKRKMPNASAVVTALKKLRSSKKKKEIEQKVSKKRLTHQ